jgi:hypothetical protein
MEGFDAPATVVRRGIFAYLSGVDRDIRFSEIARFSD